MQGSRDEDSVGADFAIFRGDLFREREVVLVPVELSECWRGLLDDHRGRRGHDQAMEKRLLTFSG